MAKASPATGGAPVLEPARTLEERLALARRDPPPAVEEEPAADKPKRGKKAAFNARQLADKLIAETPVAVGAARLHVYVGGTYRPDGERNLRRRIALRLGDEWRRSYADEVIGYLRDSADELWEAPPLDRINCANGILDLAKFRLEPHDPDFLSPVQIAAAWDPKADCEEVDRFLADVLPAELGPVIHELAGYLVTPDNSLQVAVMLLGEGANGKSTLLRLLGALIGEANVSTVPLHRLDEDRFAPAELYGKLANVFADLDARALAASSMFKAITGGDAITGERKYAAPFSFRPYARLLYSANEPPPTPDSSDAFFRRWLTLPFERRFDPATADRTLIHRLTTPSALSGLLTRGVQSIDLLRHSGSFQPTEAASAAAERFRVDSDSVAGFLADCTRLDTEGRVPRPRLFDAYRTWCEQSNRRPVSKQRFNRRVEALRPAATITAYQGVRCWAGIAMEDRS